MSESSPSRPFTGYEDPDWASFDLRKFVLSTVQSIQFDDDHNDVIEGRLLRIEECVAARWPRRWLLWRRLRRDIRASVAGFADSYIPRGDFIGRRMEACGNQMLHTDDLRHRHYEAYVEYMARRGAEPIRGGELSELAGRERARERAERDRHDAERRAQAEAEQEGGAGQQGGAEPGAGLLP